MKTYTTNHDFVVTSEARIYPNDTLCLQWTNERRSVAGNYRVVNRRGTHLELVAHRFAGRLRGNAENIFEHALGG